LDGTLLDHNTYSYAEALPALAALRDREHAVVMCSSKTRAEMLPLWRELGLISPFITENGGGIFAPEAHPVTRHGDKWQPVGQGWLMWPLGLPYTEVRKRFARFKERFGARGFGDLSEREVAELTGLTPASAARAKQRDFNEPVVLPYPDRQAKEFIKAATDEDLVVTRGGRFFHLLAGADKGRAVLTMLELMGQWKKDITSVGLGDAENDHAMMAVVDRPILVAKPDGSHAGIDLPDLEREALPGPEGFNQAILNMIQRLEAA
jgi:mannosyl-3-phosphoglycerate phosphatase